MSSKMLYEAIALIRASKTDEARRMIFEIIRNEPTNEMAWMWLAETLSSDNDRMKVLMACQMENPNSKITKMAIHKLQEKMDEDAKQENAVSPFKDGATFDPSMPERTGHTGAIIGFDGSFIVSEISDFDEVVDLRSEEEQEPVSPFTEEGADQKSDLEATQVFTGVDFSQEETEPTESDYLRDEEFELDSTKSEDTVPDITEPTEQVSTGSVFSGSEGESSEPESNDVSPFEFESLEPEDGTEGITEEEAKKISSFEFGNPTEEEPPSELEYEPDLSTLFQDEAAKLPEEQAFDFDEAFTSDESEGDLDTDLESREEQGEELTSYDLGFVDENSETLENIAPDGEEQEPSPIRSINEEDLVEDHVIESGVDEVERKRKKKDRNMKILIIALFVLIAALCVTAVFLMLNYSKFSGKTTPTSAPAVVVQTEVLPSATLPPVATPTEMPTMTPTTIPTPTPLVEISNRAINVDNAGSLQLKLEQGYQGDLVVSTDGSRVAIADGSVITIWNSVDGNQVFELDEHTSTVVGLAFSTDGKYLVSAADDFTIYLWNVRIGMLEKQFALNADAVSRVSDARGAETPLEISLDFSPDGTTVAAGTFGLVTIFDVPTGLARGSYEIDSEELTRIVTQNDSPQGFYVKFNENGWILTAAMSGHLVGLDTLDAKPLFQFDLGDYASVVYADNRQEMVISDADEVSIRGLGSGEVINSFRGVQGDPDLAGPAFGLSQNWDVLAIGSSAGQNDVQLSIWNIFQDNELATFPAVCTDGECTVPAFAFAPEGDWVAVETKVDTTVTVRLYDLSMQSDMLILDKFTSGVQAISVSPKSDLIAVMDKNGVLRVWDVKFGATRASLDATGMENIAFSKDGSVLFAWNSDTIISWSIP